MNFGAISQAPQRRCAQTTAAALPDCSAERSRHRHHPRLNHSTNQNSRQKDEPSINLAHFLIYQNKSCTAKT